MTLAALQFISDQLSGIIPYEFEEWQSEPLPDPYFVGEFSEIESMTFEEDGFQESQMIVTGTGTSWINLVESSDKIRNSLPKTAILSNGNGIAVYYAASIPIPTDDAELKRIQINLTVKEWSVK